MLPLEMQPTISYKAVHKCGITLLSFYQFHFAFHGLGEMDFFKFFPIFVFAESTIYQIDEENELGHKEDAKKHWEILTEILKKNDLYDEKIEEEFEYGRKYYGLETMMCKGESFTDENVVLANKLKCYDFRVMHRILFRLTGKPYDEDLMEFFWNIEAVADIEDDIRQYEDDISRNVYNTYRMFVKLYGKDGKKRLEQHLESLERGAREIIATWPQELQDKFNEMEQRYREVWPFPPIPEPIIEK